MRQAIDNGAVGFEDHNQPLSSHELFTTLEMSAGVRGAVFELIMGRRHFLVAIAEVDFAIEPTGGLRVATDTNVPVSSIAPYLPGAEVALTHAPWSGPLRLRVGRASASLIDKVAIRTAYDWPSSPPIQLKASHRTGTLARVFTSEDPDFTKFHGAAPDQRMSWLGGTEWFEVEGPFGTMRGTLPGVELRCRVELSAFVGSPAPVEPIMALDRMVLVPQRGVVTVGGRCHLELTDRETVDAAHFSFGAGVAGAEIRWGSDLRESGTRARPSLAKPPTTTIPPRKFGGTILLEPPARACARTMLLDATADTVPAESSSGAHTLEIDRAPLTLPFFK